ncbi:hypothetical protein [Bradyrhizobium sp.]|uniref:hypothetical protein n=1 Tax=Bradyrhizobium sp. TaxID=376 RepID=UPI003C61D67E
MTNERIPTDPYRPGLADEALEHEALERDAPEYRRGANPRPINRLEEDLQMDPELAEGRAGPGKIALFAVSVALVLGAVFYGLNHSGPQKASTAAPQTAQTQPSSPQAPSGMRDVTPHANSQPGQTTGSATNRPTPPASGPTGSEVDRSTNPQGGQSNNPH